MNLKKYFLSILCLGFLFSCSDLDIPPKNIFGEPEIFGSDEGAITYISRMYSTMPMEDFRYSFEHGFNNDGTKYRQMACATGEAVGRDTQSATAEPGANYWDGAYTAIREVNLFIETAPKYAASYSGDNFKTYMGEAHFIRAYIYYALVKRFGGVPKLDYVIDYPAHASLGDTWVARASEEECWDFIASDLDYAIDNLPVTNQKGRANKYAAAALKSRTMLHAGSIALYNTVNETIDGVRICGIPQAKANDYFKAAYDASKIVDEGSYELYKVQWSATDKAAQAKNFAALFLDETSANKETIFARYYKEKFSVHGYDDSTQPRQTSSGGNDSEVSPTVDFMEMFDGIDLDANGKFEFLDGSGYYKLYDNPMDAFANAEPRLLGTVILPMSEFKGQRIEIRRGLYTGSATPGISRIIADGETRNYADIPEITSNTNIKLATDFSGAGNPSVALASPYTPYPGATPITSINATASNGPVSGWHFGNIGGTYLRKYMNPDQTNNSGNLSTQNWIELRYAEVLLNRAEAAYELYRAGVTTASTGENYRDAAFQCINSVRERAGADLLTTSADLDDIDIVRRERRKELAFENKTYWDLKRWRIMYDEQNNTRYRIIMPFFATEVNKYFFDVRFTEPRAGHQYTFSFDTRFYYQQLPAGEITKNPNMKQNPGY